MRKLSSMIAAAMAASVLIVQPAAAAVPILSINLFRGDSNGNCEDTVSGTGCSPLGVTQAGGLANPFLNDLNSKEISLVPGSYYLFGNPFAGTNFMTEGSAISAFIRVSTGGASVGDSYLLMGNSTVPDLSVAGTTLFDFSQYGIKITTTGVTGADRMSFGYPPGAFAPDGAADFVLRLDYFVPGAAVPEPATWAMMVSGFALAGYGLRRKAALRAA
ncbi:MAG TPA: PEPxxWA-CTERM sorting domain-containing protein [Phenylobacterium sp.]|nr:PEPxxWA-CTERM sorting domain-containing protein [Phenylobacterium sp.]